MVSASDFFPTDGEWEVNHPWKDDGDAMYTVPILSGGINWLKLAKVIPASLLSLLAVGWYGLLDAATDVVITPIRAATSWAEALVGSIVGLGVLPEEPWRTSELAVEALWNDDLIFPSPISATESDGNDGVLEAGVEATMGALPDLGPLAFPAGVAVVLLGLYIADRGIELLQEGL
jgi:hypothetical protein